MNQDVLHQVCERLHAEVGAAADARAAAHKANIIAPSQTESAEWRQAKISSEGRFRQQIDSACRHFACNKSWPKMSVEIADLVSERVLRLAGWVLGSLALSAFVSISALGGGNDSAQAAAGIALLAAVGGLILILSLRRTHKVQRLGTLYHLTITYPGCDQYIQTSSSLMAFFGSNMGFGIIGTSGKLASGDVIFSSTDREAVARVSEDIEKDLRRGQSAGTGESRVSPKS
jgi:hypothetical protein